MFSFQLLVLCFAITCVQDITGHNATDRTADVFHASSSEEYDKNVREEDEQSLQCENGNECNVSKTNGQNLNLKLKLRKRGALINDLLKKSTSVLEQANVRLEGENEIIKMTFQNKKRIHKESKNVQKQNSHAVLIELEDYGSENRRVSVCSGTLLSLKWVITAAHCFNMTYGFIVIYAGGNSLGEIENNTLPYESQRRNKAEVHTHPMYDPSKKAHYDIALVMLNYPAFDQTETVRPVVFSLNYWNHQTHQNCHITDFGPNRRDDPDFRNTELFSRTTHSLLIEPSCRCFDESRKKLMLCSLTNQTVKGGLCSGVSGGGLICDGKLVAVAAGYQTVRDIDTCAMDSDVRTDCWYGDRTFTMFHQLCPYVQWISSTIGSLDSYHPLDSQCYELLESAVNDDSTDDDRRRSLNNVDTTTSNILILTLSLQLLFLTGT